MEIVDNLQNVSILINSQLQHLQYQNTLSLIDSGDKYLNLYQRKLDKNIVHVFKFNILLYKAQLLFIKSVCLTELKQYETAESTLKQALQIDFKDDYLMYYMFICVKTNQRNKITVMSRILLLSISNSNQSVHYSIKCSVALIVAIENKYFDSVSAFQILEHLHQQQNKKMLDNKNNILQIFALIKFFEFVQVKMLKMLTNRLLDQCLQLFEEELTTTVMPTKDQLKIEDLNISQTIPQLLHHTTNFKASKMSNLTQKASGKDNLFKPEYPRQHSQTLKKSDSMFLKQIDEIDNKREFIKYKKKISSCIHKLYILFQQIARKYETQLKCEQNTEQCDFIIEQQNDQELLLNLSNLDYLIKSVKMNIQLPNMNFFNQNKMNIKRDIYEKLREEDSKYTIKSKPLYGSIQLSQARSRFYIPVQRYIVHQNNVVKGIFQNINQILQNQKQPSQYKSSEETQQLNNHQEQQCPLQDQMQLPLMQNINDINLELFDIKPVQQREIHVKFFNDNMNLLKENDDELCQNDFFHGNNSILNKSDIQLNQNLKQLQQDEIYNNYYNNDQENDLQIDKSRNQYFQKFLKLCREQYKLDENQQKIVQPQLTMLFNQHMTDEKLRQFLKNSHIDDQFQFIDQLQYLLHPFQCSDIHYNEYVDKQLQKSEIKQKAQELKKQLDDQMNRSCIQTQSQKSMNSLSLNKSNINTSQQQKKLSKNLQNKRYQSLTHNNLVAAFIEPLNDDYSVQKQNKQNNEDQIESTLLKNQTEIERLQKLKFPQNIDVSNNNLSQIQDTVQNKKNLQNLQLKPPSYYYPKTSTQFLNQNCTSMLLDYEREQNYGANEITSQQMQLCLQNINLLNMRIQYLNDAALQEHNDEKVKKLKDKIDYFSILLNQQKQLYTKVQPATSISELEQKVINIIENENLIQNDDFTDLSCFKYIQKKDVSLSQLSKYDSMQPNTRSIYNSQATKSPLYQNKKSDRKMSNTDINQLDNNYQIPDFVQIQEIQKQYEQSNFLLKENIQIKQNNFQNDDFQLDQNNNLRKLSNQMNRQSSVFIDTSGTLSERLNFLKSGNELKLQKNPRTRLRNANITQLQVPHSTDCIKYMRTARQSCLFNAK